MSEHAQMMSGDEHVVLGKLTSPHGVRGWLKVYSYTSPIEGILGYPEWMLRHGDRLVRQRVLQGHRQGKGLVARLEGIESREAAEALAGTEILLPKAELPVLEAGEYYWHQLEGLRVVTPEGVCLGHVAYLFETGANDVMVVKGPADEGIEERERLLPYLPGDVVLDVDAAAGVMTVDWDPEF